MVISMSTDLAAQVICPFYIGWISRNTVADNEEGCNGIIFFQSIQYDRSIRRWSIVKCQSYHFLISIYGTVDSTIFICVVQTVTDSEFSGFNHSGRIGIVPFVTCLEFSGLDHACCICIVGRISNLKQSGFKDT